MESAISLAEPVQVVTSGYEQESLIAIWNTLHGRPTYVDRLEFPYIWVVYNWLYYAVYAGFAQVMLTVFSLTDPWLPTVTRLFTLCGVAIVLVGAFCVFTQISRPASTAQVTIRNATFSIFIAIGPLVGYWAITTRPDIWALGFEIWAIAFYWRYHDSQPLWAILLFCMTAYLAWAFKQTAVTGICALGLFLLLQRHWRDLAILVVFMPSAWLITALVGSEAYVETMLLAGYRPESSFMHAVNIVVAAVPKMLPVIFGIIYAMLWLAWSPKSASLFLKDEIVVFGLCGFVFGLILAFIPGMQYGSAENYYYAPVFFAVLIIIRFFALQRVIADEGKIRLSNFLAGGWALQGIAIAAVLFGFIGTTSVYKFHNYLMKQKDCLDTLARPLFVDNHYLSLPWMTPNNPSFVLFFGYHTDRARGFPHERGGIGGLISANYFSTLAFSNDPEGGFDRVSLENYEPVPGPCGDLLIYRRK